MLVMFLSLIIGGFLLGAVAVFTTIMILAVICGSYKGFTVVFRSSSDGLGKLGSLITNPSRGGFSAQTSKA